MRLENGHDTLLLFQQVKLRNTPGLHGANSVPTGRSVQVEMGCETITYSISDSYELENTTFCFGRRPRQNQPAMLSKRFVDSL
jgi:hypothetical protein